MYEQKPQTAVAGTKHTMVPNTNKILHKKRASKPLNPIFQNPQLRQGENPMGRDLRFTQIEQLDENVAFEHSESCSTSVLEENVLNDTLKTENTTISLVYGRGGRNLIRDRSSATTLTPGAAIYARLTTEDCDRPKP